MYVLHGLHLRSQVPLAAPHPESGGAAVDVDIRWGVPGPVPDEPLPGRVIASKSTPERRWYVATEDGGTFRLRVPGCADFVVDQRLVSVECRPDPAAGEDLVPILVAGLVVAFVLDLRGHCVLHASAVEVDGRAIAFAGQSGSGKSTLAALFCATGPRLVTDDVLRLGVDAATNRVCCVGGTSHIRLRPGAVPALDGFATPPPSYPTADHRLAVAPAAIGTTAAGDAVPLAAVVLPRPSRQARAVEVRRLAGPEAVLRLGGLTRVAGWRDPRVLTAQLDLFARLAAEVPVVEARVPWGPPFDPGLVPALLGSLPAGAR